MYEYAFMGFLTYTQACNTGNIWSKALAIKQVNQDKNAGGKKGPYKAGLERQKQILEAARQLLVEEGGHNFSIRKFHPVTYNTILRPVMSYYQL